MSFRDLTGSRDRGDASLHRNVLDNLPEGITIQDTDFNIIYQNEAMRTAFGEHVGSKCFAIYERRDGVCDGCGVQKSFEKREAVTVLRTAFEVDGTTSYWENSCFPLFDDEGSIVAGVEVCRQITDRVSLEEEVKDRNIALGQLNKELERKTHQLTMALTERQMAEQSLRTEIEERKQAEAALRESENKYRSLFEQALDAMFVADVETGILIDCNPAALKLVGRERSELVGQHQRILHPPEENESEFSESFERHRAGEVGKALEQTVITKGGERRAVSITVSTFTLEGRKVLKGMFRDITEQRQAEAELAQARKLEAVGQLAAGIAHEINTPTQFVGDNVTFLKSALADLLELQATQGRLLEAAKAGKVSRDLVAQVEAAYEEVDLEGLQEEIPEAIEASLEGIGRISKIVRAMKQFSHPGSSDMAPCDINEAIETTITVARGEWKYVAGMKTELDPSLPPVPCLLGELNQVILNLIINAAHAIGDVVGEGGNEMGTITVRTTHGDGWAEIHVSDTGRGIPAPVGERIFEPFFTTKDVGKGSGQGLAVARNVIVRKHGGDLSFESEEGKGTTFIIRLPLQSPSADRSS